MAKITKKRKKINKVVIGWREWACLPELDISAIKVKIDSGAKTSSIHAENLSFSKSKGKEFVRFDLYPLQKNKRKKVRTRSEVIDWRTVRSSNGQAHKRPVIETDLCLGPYCFPIEVTLADRDLMGFRMLLGRKAIEKRYLIDVQKSFLQETANQVVKKKKSQRKKTHGRKT